MTAPATLANAPLRIMSGLRATGRLHLGNELGAVRPFVNLLRQPDTHGFFCIADLHTLTTFRDAAALRALVPDVLLDVLAAGVDPERVVIYAQSSVPETSELAWLFASLTLVGELERVPSFKERERHRDSHPINAGMLTYPLLMAADILGLRAHRVSVGEDQYPHLELARDLARRFNRLYAIDGATAFLPEPDPLTAEPVRVPGLDGSGKMGKSLHNAISIADDKAARWNKLAPASTDPARRRTEDPGTPEHCTMFALHEHVSSPAVRDEVAEGCRSAKLTCVDCKHRLNDELEVLCGPVQLRRRDLAARPGLVREVLGDGAARARKVVRETRDVVQDRLGIVQYGSEVER